MARVRRHRSIWVGIVVVVVFFTAVTLAVAWLGGGPDVRHPVDGDWSACPVCHAADSLPDSHHDRAGDGCRSCHSESRTDAYVATDGAENAASVDD